MWTSLYYAVGAISTAGVFPPNCIDHTDDYDCQLSNLQSILAGTYIIIGVPLFELTMVEVVSLLVERSVRARERIVLKQPLTEDDFRFASEFYEDYNNDYDTIEDSSSSSIAAAGDHDRDRDKVCLYSLFYFILFYFVLFYFVSLK